MLCYLMASFKIENEHHGVITINCSIQRKTEKWNLCHSLPLYFDSTKNNRILIRIHVHIETKELVNKSKTTTTTTHEPISKDEKHHLQITTLKNRKEQSSSHRTAEIKTHAG